MLRPLFVLIAASLLLSCSRYPGDAITVSVIGGEARAANPNTVPLDMPAAVMTGAMMQGLVQFDAKGEIEPALAERWMVTDDGLSYIFRIRRTNWPDGTRVTAAHVAQSLRKSLAPASRNPMKPMLRQVSQILAMTDTVVEVRLSEPLPGLLQLLADPHMAILRNGRGTGPYWLYRSFPSAKILRPVPALTNEEISEDALRQSERRVRGENAALAIARYAERNADLVLGGDFTNFPIVQAAGLDARDIRVDPVPGLFGIIPARAEGPSQNRNLRQAMAMALDRAALIQRLGARGWTPAETLMPGPINMFIQAIPDWAALTPAERRARARSLVAQTMGDRIRIRLAMPEGPGARLIFAQMASDWRAIGIGAERVGPGKTADFRLIDMVAPTPNALWYLQPFACASIPACSAATSNALSIARRAAREERARLFAEADQAIADEQLYIPIARPLRWSLVNARLNGFAANATGQHPLNRLSGVSN